MINLERQLFSYFENLKNYMRIQPVVFAGVPGPSGGSGGPPGGIVGRLPQSAITFDTTEAETLYIPPSGSSLVDNLNRIRYRIGQIEASGGGGYLTVQSSGITIESDTTLINFRNHITVSQDSPNQVIIDGASPSGILPIDQTDVSFDATEAEVWPIPGNPTLKTNLDRIRYRVNVLEEDTGPGTITVYDNDILVASGITGLDFGGELNITVSGTVIGIEHPSWYTDNYTVSTNTTNFITSYRYILGSLRVYYNGLRQLKSNYSEGSPTYGTFTTGFTVPSGSNLIAEYQYYESSLPPASGVFGWGAIPWGNPWGV